MIYGKVIDAVNKVLEKLHLNTVDGLDGSAFASIVLDTVNFSVYDIATSGNLIDRRREKEFFIINGSVKVSASSDVHHIEDVYYGNVELRAREIYDIRRKRKQNTSFTTPTEYALANVSAGVLELNLWGIPTEVTVVDTSFYLEPIQYTIADASATIPYNFDAVVNGAYALMTLYESDAGGFDQLYADRRDKVRSKYVSDTGHTLSFVYKR